MKTKLFILGLVAAALMACSSKNEPESAKQPYVKGQTISIKCTMAAPNEGNGSSVARRITGTHQSGATQIPFTWHFDNQETLLIQDLDGEEGSNTSELQMNLEAVGSGNVANFTGKMPDSWKEGHRFIAICRAKDDIQEPAQNYKRGFDEGEDEEIISHGTTIERGEMRFESEPYTTIPETIELKAAWSAMSMNILFNFDKGESGANFASVQLDALEIYESKEAQDPLYHYEYENYIQGGNFSNLGGINITPLLVVKNGSYDNFVFKAYLTLVMSGKQNQATWAITPIDCTLAENEVDNGHVICDSANPKKMIVTFQYDGELTLKPNDYLLAQPATVHPKLVKK